jgi:hypothetical protein
MVVGDSFAYLPESRTWVSIETWVISALRIWSSA